MKLVCPAAADLALMAVAPFSSDSYSPVAVSTR